MSILTVTMDKLETYRNKVKAQRQLIDKKNYALDVKRTQIVRLHEIIATLMEVPEVKDKYELERNEITNLWELNHTLEYIQRRE